MPELSCRFFNSANDPALRNSGSPEPTTFGNGFFSKEYEYLFLRGCKWPRPISRKTSEVGVNPPAGGLFEPCPKALGLIAGNGQGS